MFRSVFNVLVLLAYLAGTGHCALATVVCLGMDGGRCHTAESTAAAEDSVAAGRLADTANYRANAANAPVAESAAESAPAVPVSDHPGHIPHGEDCDIEAALTAKLSTSGTARLLPALGGFVAAAFCLLACACARGLAPNAPPPGSASFTRRTRERLLLLARAWQFAIRAAAHPRAPGA